MLAPSSLKPSNFFLSIVLDITIRLSHLHEKDDYLSGQIVKKHTAQRWGLGPQRCGLGPELPILSTEMPAWSTAMRAWSTKMKTWSTEMRAWSTEMHTWSMEMWGWSVEMPAWSIEMLTWSREMRHWSTETWAWPRDADLVHRDASLVHSDEGLVHKDADLVYGDVGLVHRDASLVYRDANLVQRDEGLVYKDADLVHGDAGLVHRDANLVYRDADLVQRDEALVHRDAKLDHVSCTSLVYKNDSVCNPDGWDGVDDRREVQEGGGVCIPLAESGNVWQKPTQYCKAIILQLKTILKNDSVCEHDLRLHLVICRQEFWLIWASACLGLDAWQLPWLSLRLTAESGRNVQQERIKAHASWILYRCTHLQSSLVSISSANNIIGKSCKNMTSQNMRTDCFALKSIVRLGYFKINASLWIVTSAHQPIHELLPRSFCIQICKWMLQNALFFRIWKLYLIDKGDLSAQCYIQFYAEL